MKKLIFMSSLGLAILLLISLSLTAVAATKMKIFVNGEQIEGEAKLIDGVTYIPMKSVLKKLGVTINYMPDLNKIHIASSNLNIYNGVTLKNPLKLGKEGTFSIADQFIGSIEVKEVNYDESVRTKFNVELPKSDESDYIFVKIKLSILATKALNDQVEISADHFKYFDFDSNTFKEPIYFPSNLKLEAGESAEEWIVFPVNKDAQSKYISFSKNSSSLNGLWMELERG